MARPRTTPSPHAKDGESGSKSGWKDKLTAQQLSRKRAADRQLVRENRSKARQTIAALQERLDLLSTQQSDKIVAELLKENRSLEAEKETLRSKLQSVCSALGLSREESSSLLQQSSRGSTTEGIASREATTVEQPGNGTQHAVIDSAGSVPFYTEGQTLQVGSIEEGRSQCDASFDLTTELDSRMAVPDSPSPFPGIWAALGRLGSRSNLLDDDFLEAIMIWRSNTGHSGGGVFSVANALFHIGRPPGLMSQQRLRSLARTPNILYLLVQDLESSAPSSNPVLESMVPTKYPDSDDDDSLTTMRRELAIAAYEAIRPGIRTHLMRDWQSYQGRNLYSSFVEHFDVQISTDAKLQEVLQVDSNGCDIRLMPSTERWLHDINCLRMEDEFAVDFPELAELIRPASATEDPLGIRNSCADTRMAVGTLPPVNTTQLSIRASTPTAFSVTSSVEAVICSVGAAGAQEAAVDCSKNTTYLDDSFDRAFSFAEMQPPLLPGLPGVQQQPVSQAETTASEADSASSIATTAPLPVISELGRSSASDSVASTKETQHDNMAWDLFVSASPADRTYRLDPSLSEWGAMSSWSATEDDSLFGSSSLWFPAWPSA
ncbi:hypothetical protein Z517_11189 [Fonsecaea pedrosoi CBS 271.37]|uniref:BZIP domain-containing protein n=1 Tax=Fonsecaea pedrosoi CBS 271.37 TaxID=1442368 RepID=A0A0D2G731_9EURO|nr:uncharacterized protein Z517_11189 [Fonsecaea pedrosoi CBS 271.37]KIW76443.1 hypothetical protein Z517_11189 [Fonsecaea pedrosoi CBS 271.37]